MRILWKSIKIKLNIVTGFLGLSGGMLEICPHPNSQDLWMWPYLGKKKGGVFTDVIKIRISRWMWLKPTYNKQKMRRHRKRPLWGKRQRLKLSSNNLRTPEVFLIFALCFGKFSFLLNLDLGQGYWMKKWGLMIFFVEPTVDSLAILTDLRHWDVQARDNRIKRRSHTGH